MGLNRKYKQQCVSHGDNRCHLNHACVCNSPIMAPVQDGAIFKHRGPKHSGQEKHRKITTFTSTFLHFHDCETSTAHFDAHSPPQRHFSGRRVIHESGMMHADASETSRVREHAVRDSKAAPAFSCLHIRSFFAAALISIFLGCLAAAGLFVSF